jgi:para-nitrobenzyl esterase
LSRLITLSLAFVSGCAQTVDSEAEASDASPPTLAAASGTLLQLPDGPIEGRSRGPTRSFIGIPYAAPPVGGLRWKVPQPVSRWSNVLDATGEGVSCPQAPDSALDTGPQSEDCLQLNVFAPAETPPTPVPVMVWFHGGSNQSGGANAYVDRAAVLGGLITPPRLYDGAAFRELAERDVVVVTVNYRLGALGFLAHPALTAEAGATGNYGLMDQQAALRWVQRNIAVFGGDPRKVTLFGQTAGATDICYQMLASGSEKLFDAAAMQSGSCGSRLLPTANEAEAHGQDWAAALGCYGDDDVACLRNLTAEQVAHAPLENRDELSALAVIDGHFLTEQPAEALREGRFNQVPLIVGSDANEEAYGCAARQLAARVGDFTSVFLYSFARSSAYEPRPDALRTLPALEELWIWNVFSRLSPYAADDTYLSLQLRGYWTQLVDGDVNSAKPRWPRPEWPRYFPERESELVIDLAISSADELQVQRCDG